MDRRPNGEIILNSVLRVEALRVDGPNRRPILRGVGLCVGPGEAVAVVGGSGSGKSTLLLAALDLLPPGLARTAGTVAIGGRDLDSLGAAGLRRVRGADVGMVFQEPRAALNPVLSVGRQLAEPMMRHLGLSRAAALGRAAELLTRVGIASPDERLRAFPHQLSGGTCQRVMLAAALACDPSLLLADEPTSSVDPTTQLNVVRIILREVERRGMGLLLVAHDLSLVASLCDRAVVLHRGEVVESGPVRRLVDSPRHPHTVELLGAARRLRGEVAR